MRHFPEPAVEHRLLVVAEASAPCGTWEAQAPRGDVVVISQLCEETSGVFANRLAGRIERLRLAGFRPDAIILATGPEDASVAVSPRIAMVRALLGAFSPKRLVLGAASSGPAPAHYELEALAATVREAAPALDVQVAVAPVAPAPLETASARPAREASGTYPRARLASDPEPADKARLTA